MSSGRPDWHPTFLLEGKLGDSLVPIAVDAAGQLVCLFKGWDGSAARLVKVQTDGQLIALIQGEDAGTLRTIAVDADGIMKANLAVQELDLLRVRQYFDDTRQEKSYGGTIGASATKTLYTMTGAGFVRGGIVRVYGSGTLTGAELRITYPPSSDIRASWVISQLYQARIFSPDYGGVYLHEYDPVNGSFAFGFGRDVHLNFNDSIKLINPDAAVRSLDYEIHVVEDDL